MSLSVGLPKDPDAESNESRLLDESAAGGDMSDPCIRPPKES
jgi:hypothetical protein